jgi:hypothetical protein
MVVLDKGDSTAKDTTATSKLANVKIKMPAGMTAEMTVDGARIATVENGKEIAVSAGMKHIKLVGNNGLSCDDERVKLESGKTTLLECGFGGGAAATGSGSAATGSAAAGSASVGAGSAAPVTETKAQGSAAVAAVAYGSGAGSGSAAVVATKTETKPVETKTETKAVETKPVESKTTTTKTETKSSATTTKPDTTKTDTKTETKTQSAKTETKSSGGNTTKADATKGYLQVYSKPTAHILVDGKETNLKTPISGHTLPLTAGKHKITFVIGDDRFTYPVIVKAGATETMSKDLQ